MMKLNCLLKYKKFEEYQMLGLPYNGNAAKMYILLPNKRYGLQNVLSSLKSENFLINLKSLELWQVNVNLNFLIFNIY